MIWINSTFINETTDFVNKSKFDFYNCNSNQSLCSIYEGTWKTVYMND